MTSATALASLVPTSIALSSGAVRISPPSLQSRPVISSRRRLLTSPWLRSIAPCAGAGAGPSAFSLESLSAARIVAVVVVGVVVVRIVGLRIVEVAGIATEILIAVVVGVAAGFSLVIFPSGLYPTPVTAYLPLDVTTVTAVISFLVRVPVLSLRSSIKKRPWQ